MLAHMMVEARMSAHARSEVLASGDWLTAAQVAELAGFGTAKDGWGPACWFTSAHTPPLACSPS